MDRESRKFHQFMVKTSLYRLESEPVPLRQAICRKQQHIPQKWYFSDILGLRCLWSHVSILKCLPSTPAKVKKSVDFLQHCFSLLMKCNSWIPSSTLLVKILPVFQNFIKMPFLRRLSLHYISIDILFILQQEYLYSALHSQNGVKMHSTWTYQNQCWNMNGSKEEMQDMFPVPLALLEILTFSFGGVNHLSVQSLRYMRYYDWSALHMLKLWSLTKS